MDVGSGSPISDSGGGVMLSRKRFETLQLEARVFQEATNLQPVEPPPPPPMPSDPVNVPLPGKGIIGSVFGNFATLHQQHRKTKDSNLATNFSQDSDTRLA